MRGMQSSLSAVARRTRSLCSSTVELASAAVAAEVRLLRARLCVPAPAPLLLALGLSGGVDSGVAAALLLRQPGVQLRCVFMRNWDEAEERDSGASCGHRAELASALATAQKLGLHLQQVDFVREYWHSVFTPFLATVAAGGTPNPDLGCNRHIKFGALQRWALTQGCHAVVTGHYARLRPERGGEGGNQLSDAAPIVVRLLRGQDAAKDQSYFLASVAGEALRRACFPLGDLCKPTVRQVAAQLRLPAAHKRSSAGICFVGRRRFTDFLGGYLPPVAGRFRDVDGAQAGLPGHVGQQAYTHGQRARIGGHSAPWFVAGKGAGPGGEVWVAKGGNHSALFTRTALAGGLFWVAGEAPAALAQGRTAQLSVKARYGQPPEQAAVQLLATADAPRDGGELGGAWAPSARCIPLSQQDAQAEGGGSPGALLVRFAQPARAVTPGQALVLYDGDVCLGGGIVRYPGPSLHEQQ